MKRAACNSLAIHENVVDFSQICWSAFFFLLFFIASLLLHSSVLTGSLICHAAPALVGSFFSTSGKSLHFKMKDDNHKDALEKNSGVKLKCNSLRIDVNQPSQTELTRSVHFFCFFFFLTWCIDCVSFFCSHSFASLANVINGLLVRKICTKFIFV